MPLGLWPRCQPRRDWQRDLDAHAASLELEKAMRPPFCLASERTIEMLKPAPSSRAAALEPCQPRTKVLAGSAALMPDPMATPAYASSWR